MSIVVEEPFARPSGGGSFEERVGGVHARLAVVCGSLNVLHAELSVLVGEALDEGLWELAGVRSAEHWLQWQTGMSATRARTLIAVARRRDELPVCTEAFDAGLLSVDQMVVVAKHARIHNDAEVRDFAVAATVAQLSRGLVAFADRTVTESDPVDTVSCGFDGDRFTMRATGPVAEGQIVIDALQEARDALFRAGRTAVTDWDALVECCTRSLDTNTSPTRRDRYRTLIHLDTEQFDAEQFGAGRAWLNAGPGVPDSVWRQICCDGVIQPVWSTAGVPFNLGRASRTVPERLRRLVLDRDRTCRHPGCDSTHRLEVHHLVHWVDGGPTDTWNLAALCPRHHRSHHRGDYTITGPPDVNGDTRMNADRWDGLIFRHRHGWIIRPGPTITPGHPPPIPAQPYQHPTGERFNTRWFHLTDPPHPN